MGMTSGPSSGVKNEINITPLVDVVLVLLIIFMVVTPMLQRGKDVQLPAANKSENEKKGADPIILSITMDKKIWIESNGYNDDDFKTALRGELTKVPGRKVMLKGDQRLTFGDVRRVMALTQQAGAKSIGLAVQEKTNH